MSQVLRKSSKQKKKTSCIKFLKNKSIENEQISKNYLSEKLRKKSKQAYYQSIPKDFQNDMICTWQIITEMTGKSKVNSNKFPKSINANGKSIEKKETLLKAFKSVK